MFNTDSCKVNNGGCDNNAVCSHDSNTNAVKCTCKVGYTNTGSESNVVCTGDRKYIYRKHVAILSSCFADSCLVKNGGCDPNAVCSHEQTTNAVKCTCKTGYTNTGSDSNVVCTGD